VIDFHVDKFDIVVKKIASHLSFRIAEGVTSDCMSGGGFGRRIAAVRSVNSRSSDRSAFVETTANR